MSVQCVVEQWKEACDHWRRQAQLWHAVAVRMHRRRQAERAELARIKAAVVRWLDNEDEEAFAVLWQMVLEAKEAGDGVRPESI